MRGGSESLSPQTEPPSDQDSGSGGGRSGAAGACAVRSCQTRPSLKSRTRTERSRLFGLIIPVLLARRIPRMLLCPDASSPPAAPRRWFHPGNANVGVDVGRATAFNPPPPTLAPIFISFPSPRIRVGSFARRRLAPRRVRGRRGGRVKDDGI